ncbi:MAG: PD-(D/E)XK nuclease domain-containing protein, partial [Desulfovibrionaceae bacterium]|nr:PD-(D/E)XK nuclease domain-containing protein [Desulfovibrionaceae bacterium]
ILTNFLVQTASFHDYGRDPELFYHTMMAVLFSCSGDWDVLSNRESGSGRPDLILSMNNRAAVIEIKRCSNPEKLREMLKKGLAQIENNNYHATLCKSCNIVDLWCFSFSRKQCLAACRRIPAE